MSKVETNTALECGLKCAAQERERLRKVVEKVKATEKALHREELAAEERTGRSPQAHAAYIEACEDILAALNDQ